jgi:hypothetical protein
MRVEYVIRVLETDPQIFPPSFFKNQFLEAISRKQFL